MKQKIVIPELIWQQNPLFWSRQGSIAVEKKRANIFLGIGVASPRQLSQAIPFDELGFLLSAEFLKRKIPGAVVFCLIADQHAWLANQFNKKEAIKISLQQFGLISRVIANLNLEGWQFFQASKLFPKANPASYEALEERDISFFVKNHQVGIKIGWQFGQQSNIHKTDEAHFDSGSLQPFQALMIKPGMTLDPEKLHESPYLSSCKEKRIIFSLAENVREKLNNRACSKNQLAAFKNHLKKTVSLFEMMITKSPAKTPFETKIEMIIKKCLA
ncbi:hypothetical protein A2160_06060 [Candidatus Beckwithbacteria bacterium RBG_13_42_9]|uniref:Uncharacterized protein n=1 Tax=Candidatus Beckwithbacteria bacterium RBG_13_42_9 TaxID=1797457 RepID=A0A1F5E5I7_9BACT|nr:MAG: hypothetical protein A2160_06060 [Candidatus Beckwithbacteria bacterium RBG_13_42_9]